MAADRSHVLAPGDIPLVQTDRGGQVTYHGPGQLVAYPLLDIRRLGLPVRTLVMQLEQAVIRSRRSAWHRGAGAARCAGLYVEGRKLASLGLRVRRGASYHGLALNVDMDLAPFSRINPCGMAGLAVTSLAQLGVSTAWNRWAASSRGISHWDSSARSRRPEALQDEQHPWQGLQRMFSAESCSTVSTRIT